MPTWPLAVKPYAVQTEALKRASGRRAYAYFMEMGLGKTATVLAEFVNLAREGKASVLIVVCPFSLKGVWMDEAQKVGVDSSVKRAAWPNTTDTTVGEPQMVFMNYEAVITTFGSTWLMNTIERRKVMLVLDESTQVKNPQARRTKQLIQAAKSASYVRILSGQPIVQGPQDLWSQFRMLGQFSGMNFFVYRNTFCKMGGYLGKQVIGVKDEELPRLNSIIEANAFRARKDQWLDLPKQIFTNRQLELTKQQRKHYDDMKKHLITMIEEEEIDAQMIITQMLKLQQISSGFIMDSSGIVHHIEGGNPKLDVVSEIMEEVTGKVVFFTWFRESTRALLERLSPRYAPASIAGGMAPEVIESNKTRFEKDPACRAIVCQIQSGKYGLTLLGGPGNDRCATTVFYENSFSLDSRIQAEARNHRIGQDMPVVYIDLITSDVDRVVVRALEKKQDVAAAIVDNKQVLGVAEGKKARIK